MLKPMNELARKRKFVGRHRLMYTVWALKPFAPLLNQLCVLNALLADRCTRSHLFRHVSAQSAKGQRSWRLLVAACHFAFPQCSLAITFRSPITDGFQFSLAGSTDAHIQRCPCAQCWRWLHQAEARRGASNNTIPCACKQGLCVH